MTSFQDAPDENIEHDEKMELRSNCDLIFCWAHYLSYLLILFILCCVSTEILLYIIYCAVGNLSVRTTSNIRKFVLGLIEIYLNCGLICCCCCCCCWAHEELPPAHIYYVIFIIIYCENNLIVGMGFLQPYYSAIIFTIHIFISINYLFVEDANVEIHPPWW